MNDTILSKILQVQAGDRDAMQELLKKFAPLLKKYAYLLKMEDAYEELQCNFLTALVNLDINRLISKSDGAIINYIQQSIYHSYIALSKAKRKDSKIVHTDDLQDLDPLQYDARFSTNDQHNALLLHDLQDMLTDTEYKVICGLYFERYTVSELAQILGKTRQAVNQAKKRALIKLQTLINA